MPFDVLLLTVSICREREELVCECVCERERENCSFSFPSSLLYCTVQLRPISGETNASAQAQKSPNQKMQVNPELVFLSCGLCHEHSISAETHKALRSSRIPRVAIFGCCLLHPHTRACKAPLSATVTLRVPPCTHTHTDIHICNHLL